MLTVGVAYEVITRYAAGEAGGIMIPLGVVLVMCGISVFSIDLSNKLDPS